MPMSVVDTLQNVVVIVDSINNNLSIPDTLKINILESSKTFYEHPLFIGLIAAAIAAIATVIGVIIGQRLQHKTLKEIYNEQGQLNRDKELFIMRMEGCLEIAEAMSKLYHVTILKKDLPETEIFPTAYKSYDILRQWNTDTTLLVDRKHLLLNQDVYSKFTMLNRLVLKHLDEIEESDQPNHKWERMCRDIGRRDRTIIQEMQGDVIVSIKDFIKDKYKIDLEVIR